MRTTRSLYIPQPTPTPTLCGWMRLYDDANAEFARSQGWHQVRHVNAPNGTEVTICVIWKSEIFPNTDAVRKYRLVLPDFLNAIYVCARALEEFEDDGPEFHATIDNLHVDPELRRALT